MERTSPYPTVLIIGGKYQNKIDVAVRLFGPSDRIVTHFNDDFREYRDKITLDTCRGMVIIADEVGSGIVPLDPKERAFREDLGRFLCDLAAISDIVIRVSCGIPQVIKGVVR